MLKIYFEKKLLKYSMNAMVIDEFCVQVCINIICTTVSSSDYTGVPPQKSQTPPKIMIDSGTQL